MFTFVELAGSHSEIGIPQPADGIERAKVHKRLEFRIGALKVVLEPQQITEGIVKRRWILDRGRRLGWKALSADFRSPWRKLRLPSASFSGVDSPTVLTSESSRARHNF